MKKKSIFIIDDDRDILEALDIYFHEVGFTVFSSEDGDRVMNETKKIKPDVILLDLLLSGNDGADITKELKSDKETKNVPIVIISAHPNAKQRAKACGADDFLAKPFDLDELLKKVEGCIKDTPAKEELGLLS